MTAPASIPSKSPPALSPDQARALLASAPTTNHPFIPAPGGTSPRRLPVSVVILTYNEELNIRDCIASCAWCDDVHILDSGSTDRTCDIARAMGATVHVNKFKSFGDQRNWAIDHIPCKHPWHFHLDADERFTPKLLEEMLVLLGEDGSKCDFACFQCPSKMILMGQWLKWSGGYPSYQVRLFRYGQCRFMDFGHGQREDTTGKIGVLKTPYMHYNFSKGLLEWFYKHNDYSSREADEALLIRSHGKPSWKALIGGDHVARRRAWKNRSYFMHGRAVWRFLYNYALRFGLLDGIAGFRYCSMISSYEYWTELKIKERARSWAATTNAKVERMLAEPADTASPSPTAPSSSLPTSHLPLPTSPKGPHNPTGLSNTSKGRVDILIPTLNEAAVIRDTVQNALALGPVFVLDSLSTDGTQQIAREAGATVIEQKFLGYARQKNWGLENLPFKGEWVFILDADERITPQLRNEVLRTIDDPFAADGFFVNRVVLFMGRAIRHGGLYPSWNLRFFRRGKCRYEDRSVHEHMVCDGPTEYLRNEMLHIRGEGVHEWIRKHVRYADLESDEWVKLRFGQEAGASAGQLFRHTLRYRQYLRREIWPRTPLKPLLRFFYMYFLRLGVLDGFAGVHMATMMSIYEYMIELLYRDKLSRIASGAIPPPQARVAAAPAPTPPPRPAPASAPAAEAV